MISFFINLPRPSALPHRRPWCPARLCHTGATQDAGDLGEKEPSPRCSGAETLERFSKLQPLQLNPSWCCQQEGETRAPWGDRMMRMQVAGVSTLRTPWAPIPPLKRAELSMVSAPGHRSKWWLVSTKNLHMSCLI